MTTTLDPKTADRLGILPGATVGWLDAGKLQTATVLSVEELGVRVRRDRLIRWDEITMPW